MRRIRNSRVHASTILQLLWPHMKLICVWSMLADLKLWRLNWVHWQIHAKRCCIIVNYKSLYGTATDWTVLTFVDLMPWHQQINKIFYTLREPLNRSQSDSNSGQHYLIQKFACTIFALGSGKMFCVAYNLSSEFNGMSHTPCAAFYYSNVIHNT